MRGPLAGRSPSRRGERVHSMRIVHVITRLIIGGAQENTLLTVEGLHHRFGDDVTLISGPAEGPEGDLFDRAERLGLKVEMMPELVRRIRPATDLRAYFRLRRAIRRLKPEVVHTHSSKAGIIGRAAAWHERVPAVVHTIHGLPFGPSEPPLTSRTYVALEALGRPAVPRDRQRLRRDDRAGAGGRGRPARAVSDGRQRHGRRGVPEPAPVARRGSPRAGTGRRRGRIWHRRPALRSQGARRHPRGGSGGPRRQSQGPFRLHRRWHPPRLFDRRDRAAGPPARVPLRRPGLP